MLKKIFILVITCVSITIASYAQIREIPTPVKDAFAAQYPDAKEAQYKDYLTQVSVSFTQDGQKMNASYDNKGNWKQTEKEWNFDQLPQEVKDGFNKSKYADWKIEQAVILSLPVNKEQYRIKVSKSEVQKKYLFFNNSGRLLRDAITL